MKKKETDEEANKSKQNDDEVELSKKNLDKEQEGNDETKRGAPNVTDSFHPQDSNLTSVQEDRGETPKAKDESKERKAKGSTKDSDERLKVDGTIQVTEDHFNGKKAGEREEDGDESKKKPREQTS